MRGPEHMGAFEFVVIASLRSAQLARGCTPKFRSSHKHTVTAQWEVLVGHVTRSVAVQTRVVDDAAAAAPNHDGKNPTTQ
jgi:hypothetical protein